MAYSDKIAKWEATALERTLKIQNSHPFIKQEDKTQIITAKHRKSDIYRTRQTHVQETAVIAKIIATRIGFRYTEQLHNVSIQHDLGHAPYGHAGGEILDKIFKEAGLVEGFNDNNANFDVIANNQIKLSDYELASIVKKPGNLYGYQKKMLLPMIEEANRFEAEEWGVAKSRPMASLIMDLADEISYGFSDFIDGYALGYTKFTAYNFVQFLIKKTEVKAIKKILKKIAKNIVAMTSKREIRELVSNLRIEIIHSVYYDKESGSLKMEANNAEILKEIIKFNFNEFIRHPKIMEERKELLENLEEYTRFVIKNKYFTSNFYRKQYMKAKTKEDKLRALRNMIGDSTDSYVSNFVETNLREKAVK